ncbi:MAG: ABC transporter permease [Candidatus Tectomicrobia bacterium]|nr:ABC transporter permease [Candidatus Tectomicrobia bacterium]
MKTRSPVLAIAKKEVIHIRRDRRTLGLVLAFPVFMLIVYGYGITYDVRRVPLVILDREESEESHGLVLSLTESGYFELYRSVTRYEDLETLLDRGKARIGLVIPSDFSRDLKAQRRPRLQTLVDGSDPNTANVAIGYLQGAIRQYSLRVSGSQSVEIERVLKSSINVRSRIWYNPELKSVYFIVPGIIAIIMMMMGSVLTALTIAGEKERGTIEAIIASPINPSQLIIGKLIPYTVISLVDVIIIITVGYLLFQVPIKGSFLLLLVMAFFYLVGVLGIGIFVSTLVTTLESAMLMDVLFSLNPSVFLSGFVFPIENTPFVIQLICQVVPATHFLKIIRGIYLKGIGFSILWKEAAFLLAFDLIMIFVAIKRFGRNL